MNLLIVDDEVLAIQGLVDDMDWKKLDFDEVFTANSYAQAVNLSLIHIFRGGTDGARLSFMGLPCPNLGTGSYACHGPYEHATAEGMDIVVAVSYTHLDVYKRQLSCWSSQRSCWLPSSMWSAYPFPWDLRSRRAAFSSGPTALRWKATRKCCRTI